MTTTADRGPVPAVAMRARRRPVMGRLSDRKRAEVLDLARSGLPRNEVARRADVGTSTVSRLCAAEGITFDRAATAAATEAKVTDVKAGRIGHAAALLDDLAHARRQLRSAETARDLADVARAVSLLAAAHVRLVQVDPDDGGVEEAKGLLTQFVDDLRVWHDAGQPALHLMHTDDHAEETA